MSSGTFLLADAPGRTVPGWLDKTGRWPVVALAEPLTPGMREVTKPGSCSSTSPHIGTSAVPKVGQATSRRGTGFAPFVWA
jgi:hypothetical protein